jgi:hypothetical protein
MGTIGQDIRYGVRMLVKHRLTTLVCVAALALGIGANAAMFSVAEAFLLHPVPFENSDRIVALVDSRPSQGIDTNSVAPITYLEWKAQAHSFDEMGAYVWDSINLTGDREAEKVQGFAVSANLFDVLGALSSRKKSKLEKIKSSSSATACGRGDTRLIRSSSARNSKSMGRPLKLSE